MAIMPCFYAVKSHVVHKISDKSKKHTVSSKRYIIRMVKVNGTIVPGASLLLLQFVDECERDILLTLLLCF